MTGPLEGLGLKPPAVRVFEGDSVETRVMWRVAAEGVDDAGTWTGALALRGVSLGLGANEGKEGGAES